MRIFSTNISGLKALMGRASVLAKKSFLFNRTSETISFASCNEISELFEGVQLSPKDVGRSDDISKMPIASGEIYIGDQKAKKLPLDFHDEKIARMIDPSKPEYWMRLASVDSELDSRLSGSQHVVNFDNYSAPLFAYVPLRDNSLRIYISQQGRKQHFALQGEGDQGRMVRLDRALAMGISGPWLNYELGVHQGEVFFLNLGVVPSTVRELFDDADSFAWVNIEMGLRFLKSYFRIKPVLRFDHTGACVGISWNAKILLKLENIDRPITWLALPRSMKSD